MQAWRLALAILCTILVLLASVVAQAQEKDVIQAAPQPPPNDESQLLPIRLAARGSDFELAQKRLARLKKPYLVAKGTAALAAEYARAGEMDKAEELFKAAEGLISASAIQKRNRASSYLYTAQLLHEVPDHPEAWDDWAQQLFIKAQKQVGSMAGFDLNMGLIELARTGYILTSDEEQSKSILSLITDQALREKMMVLYGFTQAEASSGN